MLSLCGVLSCNFVVFPLVQIFLVYLSQRQRVKITCPMLPRRRGPEAVDRKFEKVRSVSVMGQCPLSPCNFIFQF